MPNLARPAGNATGFSLLATELSGKRLEILHEIVPNMSRLAMLWNDTNPGMVLRAREAQEAGAKLGVTIQSLGVHDLVDFEAAFAAIRSGRTAALLTLVDPFTREHRKRIVDLAAQLRLPSIYESREFVESGGLVCYGPSLIAMQRRLEFAGALYHLTARGNARADVFAVDEDRRLFLELLGKEISQQRRRGYAYCLMDNHFHLLIETPEPNLVAGMRRLNRVYTQSFNRRHGRAGHVFQGRYQSIVVDKDSYGLELSRYAVLNPVRARRLKHPQNWPWSSYRATVGRVAACLRSCRDRILVVRDASRLARRPIAKKDLDICLHGSYHAFRCSYFKPMSWLKPKKTEFSIISI